MFPASYPFVSETPSSHHNLGNPSGVHCTVSLSRKQANDQEPLSISQKEWAGTAEYVCRQFQGSISDGRSGASCPFPLRGPSLQKRGHGQGHSDQGREIWRVKENTYRETQIIHVTRKSKDLHTSFLFSIILCWNDGALIFKWVFPPFKSDAGRWKIS